MQRYNGKNLRKLINLIYFLINNKKILNKYYFLFTIIIETLLIYQFEIIKPGIQLFPKNSIIYFQNISHAKNKNKKKTYLIKTKTTKRKIFNHFQKLGLKELRDSQNPQLLIISQIQVTNKQ
ncbi:hypothetical protein PPERSA_08402 [Pseudocohnilembus persalinus]|uniref:Uncharacterized protein n=1 Tax=Pseudocohnilembus persalinus TaxID=266149 RepID=A0A0V0R668_PSEPJ|nr:hypothetical protein PPERSA_08402 [Pseudocohnilembus persalinus]|eukprot:KRX09999.1 hypothetical protein PPERSA_08402 [Pseudocohnilembus persalinus]